jgi:hypothetical protein
MKALFILLWPLLASVNAVTPQLSIEYVEGYIPWELHKLTDFAELTRHHVKLVHECIIVQSLN